MAMTDLSTLDVKVLTRCMGCPLPLVKQAIREGATQFCRNTGIWRVRLDGDDTIYTEAGEKNYAATLPETYTAFIKRVSAVYHNGSTTPMDEGRWAFGPDGVLRLASAPSADDETLVLEVVLIPSDDAEDLPDWLVARWGRGIWQRAVAELKGMAGKKWSDGAGAREAMREAEKVEGEAKIEVADGRKSGRLTARAPQWR
jgi:hypothetical protein